MQVLFDVDGRKAIPVRALPFVTNWTAAPDEIARACHEELESKFGNGLVIPNRYALPTYSFDSEGIIQPMPPAAWGHVIVRVESRSKQLQANERIENANWAQWREEAISLLPDTVFVWLDDFQTWFSRSRPLKSRGIPVTGEDIEFEQESDALNSFPIVPPELHGVVIAGFQAHFREEGTAKRAKPSTTGPTGKPLDRQTLLRLRQAVSIEDAAELLTGKGGYCKEHIAAIALIREAIERGDLEPERAHYWGEDSWSFDASRAVIDQTSTTVSVANFDAWRASISLTGVDSAPAAPLAEQAGDTDQTADTVPKHGQAVREQAPPASGEVPEPWIVRAREYADNIWLRLLASNKRPTKEGIADEIAGRLWRDDKMVTRHNKRINATYIVRFALSPTANGGWQPPQSD